MNPNAHEIATLKEFLRIYTETEETMSRYRRIKMIVSFIALGLIMLSLIGGSAGFLHAREAVFAALFGGMAAGLSFLYRSSLQQIPILLKFTTLDVAAINKRIQESEDASPSAK